MSTRRTFPLPALLACLWASASGVPACSSESRLREGGPTGFVRCLAAPPAASRSWHVGRLSFALSERVLTVRGAHDPLRLAVFSGAGFGAPPDASKVQELRHADVDLVVMLGGLGESDASATTTMSVLGALPQPVLFVAGGRDTLGRVAQAFDAAAKTAPRVLDATRLREIRVGNDTLLPIAGAEAGRYSVSDDGCGYSPADLHARAAELGSAAAGVRRWLLSWQAPAGGGKEAVARTPEGVDVGAPVLADFVAHVGAVGGLHAWPHARIETSQSGRLRLVVPRLFGPTAERLDGSLPAPAFVKLELGDAGLRVLP